MTSPAPTFFRNYKTGIVLMLYELADSSLPSFPCTGIPSSRLSLSKFFIDCLIRLIRLILIVSPVREKDK
jgi:hypothetical protein